MGRGFSSPKRDNGAERELGMLDTEYIIAIKWITLVRLARLIIDLASNAKALAGRARPSKRPLSPTGVEADG